MWIPKGAALIRGLRLFEARRLLEEIRYTYVYSRQNQTTPLRGKFIQMPNFLC